MQLFVSQNCFVLNFLFLICVIDGMNSRAFCINLKDFPHSNIQSYWVAGDQIIQTPIM